MARPPGPAPARAARMLPAVVALSGAAALVYESLWMRSFGLVFGSTQAAVAAVLAVFMGGLAVGGALAARRPALRPLFAYARVELLAGVFALLSLPLLRALPAAYAAAASATRASSGVEFVGRLLLASLVLLPPTVLLGATVPLATAFLERAGGDVRAGFGRLYLANTLGGAAGVALAGFVLLPTVGVRGTLALACACSLLAGAVTLRWARAVEPSSPPVVPVPATPAGSLRPRRLALVLAVVSGAATFGVEVLWRRSLVLVIGSSTYAFQVMLLAVLLGIALGSRVYEQRRERIARPLSTVGALFVAAGATVLAGQWLIGRLPIVWLLLAGWLPDSFALRQLAALVACFLTLVPVCGVLGLTFPLLLHLVRDPRSPTPVQADAGRLYAWNTAGAIAGALAAHLWLVPRLGLQPPYLVFAGLLLLGGLWALMEDAGAPTWRTAAATLLATAVLAGVVPRWRAWDPVLASAGVYRYAAQWNDALVPALELSDWLRSERRLLFYREGEEAVVAVAEPREGGRRFLSVNGKTDAGSGAEDVLTQKLIAHVPLLLHGKAARVLVVGWGAGATAAAAALHPVDAVECVEIEKATWQAAPFFSEMNGALARDPRFRIVFGDGRNHLLRSRRLYDVIVSEPSNPWITGVANLFTREFYETVRARLAAGGVFGQWFHYYGLEAADVKVEIRTFLSVFPEASLWLVPPAAAPDGSRRLAADLLLVGSREPQPLDWARLERAFADGGVGADLRSTRVLDDPASVVAAWAMGAAEMRRWSDDHAGPAPLNTDDYPYIELVAPRREAGRPADAARAAAAQYEALGRASGEVWRVIAGQPALSAGGPLAAVFLDRLAERYVRMAQPDRAIATFLAAIERDPRDATAWTRAGALLLERGRPAEAEPRLAEAVRLDPTRARAWEGLGAIASDRRDYPRAEEAERALLRLEPANVSAWLRLGAALARQAKWAGAQDALETARSIDAKAPVDPELLAYVRRQARGLAVAR
ncbi:MAG TPA: tetratricopeptide repeat protein [Vicinamibacteria bacterium]|nr:tetratricopeptide repeat protein [Vicinamibacteria bacterium]